jgi:purine-binding chemotaxis protein CheW
VIGATNQGKSVMETMLAVEQGAANGQSSGSGGKFLTFTLGSEEYGVPVLKVREIIKVMDITQVPQVPDYVLGVINLRGKVIPVIDLRRKFGFPAMEHTERTCIIVVDVDLPAMRVMMGVVVDAVSEVLNVTDAEIEDTPEFGGRATTAYLLGLAKVKDSVKILLDLDRVLGSDGQIGTRAS